MDSPQTSATTTRRAVPQSLSLSVRKRRNQLSLFRFSEQAVLSPNRWSDFEAEAALPTETELWRLAKVLECPFQELLLATDQLDHFVHVITPHCLTLYGALLEAYALYLGEEIDSTNATTLKNGSVILCLQKNWRSLRIKFPGTPRDTCYIVRECTHGAFALVPIVSVATLQQAIQWLSGNTP